MIKKCQRCGRDFPTSLLMFQHRRSHSFYRPYICKYSSCCQAFTCASDLQRHFRTHTDRRVYMCNICKTRFLFRHHLKLHRCRIRNTKVYRCHLCAAVFVQVLSLSHHIWKEHWNFLRKKIKCARKRLNQKESDEDVLKDSSKSRNRDTENTGQKILLKIKSGTCTTLISPDKEKKSSHMKHKRKKAKQKIDILQPAISIKNGLILKIRPVLPKQESNKTLRKHSKSRTKLKHKNKESSTIQQSPGLKLRIRTDQGSSHVILDSEADKKVPKLFVSKQNIESVQRSISKLSGSLLTSKNIVKKYKNKKNVSENSVGNVELESCDKDNMPESFPRIKNGVIIHKDRLGNYTSAEQIGLAESKKWDVPKVTRDEWQIPKAEKKSSKEKKNSVPKFTQGIWSVMPSPRPDGTPDLMKIRLSPQKPPPKLETNPDILYESSKFFGLESKSKGDTPLSEDSDVIGTSPATEKDLELGINSVNDSGIEVLSSSSCNRSNGNSVRSVLLDENSPSYFHGEDSLTSFDSPVNDSSKYEHSICGKCGGIVLEPNNNTYSPTKCHCDSNSPSHDFQEKAGYIYISPLKDPSMSSLHYKTVPRFKMDDKINTLVNVASETLTSHSNSTLLNETEHHCDNNLSLTSQNDLNLKSEKSVFDFNEDEDFSEGKPVLDHVKNPLILNKTDDEKKQESILLADLQEHVQQETQKKRSRKNKISKSPRRKSARQIYKKSYPCATSPSHSIGLLSSKPIIIDEEDHADLSTRNEDCKMTFRSKSADLMTNDKSLSSNKSKKALLNKEQDEFGLQLKKNIVSDTTDPIIVAVAKTEKTQEKESNKDTSCKSSNIETGDKITDSKNGADVLGISENDSIQFDGDSDFETIDIANGSAEQNQEILVQEKTEYEEAGSENADHEDSEIIVESSAQKLDDQKPEEQLSEITTENNNRVSGEIETYICSSKPKNAEKTCKITNGIHEEDMKRTNDDSDTEEIKSFVDSGISNTSENHSSFAKEIIVMNEKEKSPIVNEIIKEDEDTLYLKNEKISHDQVVIQNKKLNASESDDIGMVKEKETESLEVESDHDSQPNGSEVEVPKAMLHLQKGSKIGGGKTNMAFLKNTEEDSLLQIPVPDNETDLNAALEQAGLGVKTTVVMTSAEDSVLNIPHTSSTATVKTNSDAVTKSPLDLFQQQFLSFLSSKSPDPLDSDDESNVNISSECDKENKMKPGNRVKQIKSCSRSNSKDSQKFVETGGQTPVLDLISNGDSDSDFEFPIQKSRKRRKKSYLKENKGDNFNSKVGSMIEDPVKSEKTDTKGSRKAADIDNANNHIIIVKSPNLEDDIEIKIPQQNSEREFETLYHGRERKKSQIKKTANILQRSGTSTQGYRDFDSHDDESNVIVSDSDLERLGSSNSELDDDPFEPKLKKYKSCRQRSLNLKLNEDEDNSKESYQGSFDTQSIESAECRSKRSKRGRKSICPCCIGSPGRHRRERHQQMMDYKLPRNHKKFIADTVRLLEMKAKIHRLFLSLFPECKDLITRSDINTIAFDDLIDDVLSTLKSDIQFEPGSGIFTEPVIANYHDPDIVNNCPVESYINPDENVSELKSENLSSVVYVPGIQLMYSDDSVINSSQVQNTVPQESTDTTITAPNLLPPLITSDADKIDSEITVNKVDVKNMSEDPLTVEAIYTDQNVAAADTKAADYDLQESGSKENDASLQRSAQDSSVTSEPVVTNATVIASDVFVTNDIISNDTLETVPVLETSSTICSSMEQVPVDILSNNPAEDNSAGQIEENECDEIVITIDLSAAKVQLCKNPKYCLKQLQSKIVRLVHCLLPDLQVSPDVFENIENLEFLLDLIIMSNNSSIEAQSFFSSSISADCSSSKLAKKQVNPLPPGRKFFKRTLNRIKSEDNFIEFRKKKQRKETLKRRSKSTEKASLLKKSKTSENSFEKSWSPPLVSKFCGKSLGRGVKICDRMKVKQDTYKGIPDKKSSLEDTAKTVRGSKATDSKSTETLVNRCSFKRAKLDTVDSENVSVVTIIYSERAESSETGDPSENMKFSGNVATDSVIPEFPMETAGQAQTDESERKADINFELEFVGNIFDKMETAENGRCGGNILGKRDSVTNEGNIFDKVDSVTGDTSDKLTNPVCVARNSLVRTPSPEKAVGGFSPDPKRRSLDKNIFELLQPASADSSV